MFYLELTRISFRFPTLDSRSSEFTSRRGWTAAFGSAPTQCSHLKGRATTCTTSTPGTLQTHSPLGNLLSFSWRTAAATNDVFCFCSFCAYRGLQKLVLRNVTYGLGEMYRGVFLGAQIKILQKYIPELSLSDVLR